MVYFFNRAKLAIKNEKSLKFRLFELMTKAYNFAEFANFLVFVCGGRYPQLIHRILEIKYVSTRSGFLVVFPFVTKIRCLSSLTNSDGLTTSI